MSQTNVEEPQRVIVSQGGEGEYTFPYTWTETSSADVTACAVTVGLGDDEFPSDVWVAPDRLSNPTISSIRFQLKIASATAVGTYWTWIKIETGDETIIRRCAKLVVA